MDELCVVGVIWWSPCAYTGGSFAAAAAATAAEAMLMCFVQVDIARVQMTGAATAATGAATAKVTTASSPVADTVLSWCCVWVTGSVLVCDRCMCYDNIQIGMTNAKQWASSNSCAAA
jgi:hypothetical protein